MLFLSFFFFTACAISSGRYYTISKGDTIQQIASQHKLHVRDLKKFNREATWAAGEKIYIPYERAQFAEPVARAGTRTKGKTKNVLKLDKYYGKNFRKHGLIWPVKKPTVTSRFGVRGYRFHEGIDISAPRHTPIYASASGKIVYANSRISGYGRMVIIQHHSGIQTVYAHLQKMKVKVGQNVKKGALIGSVGTSGKATGPHLHFEVRRGTKPHNPLLYLPRKAQVAGLTP